MAICDYWQNNSFIFFEKVVQKSKWPYIYIIKQTQKNKRHENDSKKLKKR